MIEFRGVVNIDAKGEVVCFCSELEVLQGKCICQKKDNCPEAIINIEVIPGTRPSERGVKRAAEVSRDLDREVVKIKEGLSSLEKAIKKTKFRL